MSTKRNLSLLKYAALLAAGCMVFYFSKIIGIMIIAMGGYGMIFLRDDA